MADMTDLDSILQRPLRLDKIALDDSVSWLELVVLWILGFTKNVLGDGQERLRLSLTTCRRIRVSILL